MIDGGLARSNLGKEVCPTRNGMIALRVAVVNAAYPPEPVVSAQMGRDLPPWAGGFSGGPRGW